MSRHAIVVGARRAGASAALLLARRGYKVLLVGHAAPSRDDWVSDYLQPPAVMRLKRWGLLDRVVGRIYPAVRSGTMDYGVCRVQGSAPPMEGVGEGYCVRRSMLDRILIDAAVQAGAVFQEGITVQNLLEHNGRVRGVCGTTPRGGAFAEAAEVVIGADGMHSVVARLVRAPEYSVVEPLTCCHSSFWSGLHLAGFELHPREGRLLAGVPTRDGLTLISVMARRGEFRGFRADLEGCFLRALDLVPALGSRVREGRREGPFLSSADTPNFFRKPHGPGWALIGEAGLHQDPITAHGATNAFRDAELLAEALDAGFSGRRPIECALSEFHRQRDAAARPMYEYTCQLASLEPPSAEQTAFFEALREDPAEANRFFGTIAGTVPIHEFYAPEHLHRLIGRRRAPASDTRTHIRAVDFGPFRLPTQCRQP